MRSKVSNVYKIGEFTCINKGGKLNSLVLIDWRIFCTYEGL